MRKTPGKQTVLEHFGSSKGDHFGGHLFAKAVLELITPELQGTRKSTSECWDIVAFWPGRIKIRNLELEI